jgi:peptidoglycan/xylan/chitin deacetylase (PgdA/CDA1 family)
LELIEKLLAAVLAMWALLPDLWFRWKSSTVFRRGKAGDRVALTFDDGPDPVYTPRILDILAEGGASATFFLVAENARRYPDVVRQIVARGHEVGSHGMHHAPFWLLTPRRSRLEIQESVAMLQELTRTPVRCFRPPWGMFNLIAHYWMRRTDQRPVLWSLDSLDWFFLTPARLIYRKVSRRVRPGSVVLFHDGRGVGRTAAALVEALPQLLDNLKARGLVPVTVSELMDEGERMGRKYECGERSHESIGDCQAPGGVHCGDDQHGFMGRPAFPAADLT